MAKYKAYPGYKDSGVEWLGDIPSTWNIVHIKHITIIINGSTPRSDIDAFWNGEINWLTPTDLSKKKGKFIYSSLRTITKRGLNSCGASLVPPNTVILSTRAPIGSLALNKISSCTNQGCKSLVCKNDNLSTFIYYWLTILNEQLNNLGRGSTFLELSSEDLGQVKISIPNEKIDKTVCFLNSATAKIDKLIDKQHQLIKLLKEKRQAVISHTVTKGLNPNVPMKDSGVEWLGKIPTHWIVCHLKQLAKIRNGQDYKSIESETGFPVIGSGGQFAYAKNYIYDKPSVLLGRKGTIDKPLYMDSCFWAVDTMFYTEVNKNIIAKYLYYISTTIQFEKYSTNTALPSMTQENLGNYSLCYSLDPEEQQNILDFIELNKNKIDTLIQKQLQQIDLLKERRTALISAAVTGKIDLRNWTPPASSTEASLTAEEATA